jgi:hypothetical protein
MSLVATVEPGPHLELSLVIVLCWDQFSLIPRLMVDIWGTMTELSRIERRHPVKIRHL